MPRTERQVELLRRVGTEGSRLADLGYTVSTGPLVWNRHKDSLRVRRKEGCYPLLWAESVRPEGGFEFRAAKRNHKPYFRPKADERWVVTDFPCVLLQRTTAKEQCRRCGSWVNWVSIRLTGNSRRRCLIPRKERESLAALVAANADLTDANLTRANLTRANLTDARCLPSCPPT